MIRTISRFSDIPSVCRLVVLDIDNTVIRDNFTKQWWDEYYNSCRKIINCSNTAHDMTVKRWQKMLKDGQISFQHTDRQGLSYLADFCKKNNIPIISLTARGKEICESTAYTLNELGIYFDNIECSPEHLFSHQGVFYLDGGNKGRALADIIALNKFQSVTFVDDCIQNHQHVLIEMNKIGVRSDCYLFCAE